MMDEKYRKIVVEILSYLQHTPFLYCSTRYHTFEESGKHQNQQRTAQAHFNMHRYSNRRNVRVKQQKCCSTEIVAQYHPRKLLCAVHPLNLSRAERSIKVTNRNRPSNLGARPGHSNTSR
ncbi:hypothetical protein VCUG_02493 [Vavraia culicis subsp. floridensis]|uniref:Uncharacterized protein n=1 Tax=Vavraia culicis (isolate floridensis) TaxID=948595 RepID=L2GRL3_VAVCU|nr:uncharacterized protein VCUG_02493 [Vavraia culicis subsp. floridensis]ELA46017.1 hypothetical protein VCUG_02493 [Vavraia culicis subsp. floridensis]